MQQNTAYTEKSMEDFDLGEQLLGDCGEQAEPDSDDVHSSEQWFQVDENGSEHFFPQLLAEHFVGEDKVLSADHGFFQWDTKEKYWRPKSDAAIRKDIHQHLGNRCGIKPRWIDETVKLIKAAGYIPSNDLNPCPHLLNLQNGILDLEKGELLDYDPGYLFTYKMPVKFNPKAECPNWCWFLSDIFDDEDKIRCLQDFLGYCLFADCSLEKALFLLGKGANGKSTINEGALHPIYGPDLLSDLTLQDLDNRFMTHLLFGKMINIGYEINDTYFKSSDKFKRLVSGEPLVCDVKYREPFTLIPRAKHIFACNSLPHFHDRTLGFKRRLIIMKFDKVISPGKKDPKLKSAKLPAERDGIFQWILQGYRRVVKTGDIYVPESIQRDTDEQLRKQNTVLLFVDECCVLGPDCIVSVTRLYNRYKDFCHESGHQPLSKNKFNSELGSNHEGQILYGDNVRFPGTRERAYKGVRLYEGE